jgi:phosphatidylinositol alpha-1,6-mannosyltransferase
VLVVTRNLPPLRGGMERLNLHMLQELSSAFEVQVCCPQDSVPGLPQGIAATGVPLRPLSRFVVSSAFAAVAAARRFRPQLVLAGSGLTAPMVRIAARACGARSAAYLHGLDIVADHRAYRGLWRPWFRGLDAVLVNSRHTAGLAAQAGVAPRRISIVHPGVELPPWETQRGDEFLREFALEGRPILLSVGRLTARKGLVEFIQRAMPALVAAEPRLALAVIGAEASDSIKSDGQSQLGRIQSAVQQLGLEDQVRLLGPRDDLTVRGALFAARALVFPLIELPGDTEGFGMVAVEAAAHGVPTVAFAVGGATDSVADPVSGSLIAAADYPAMIGRLRAILAAPAEPEEARLRRRAFAAGFEWPRFGERVRSVCEALLDGDRGRGS